ncbi:GNAT family N-acetyltransferase [Clostridium algidicarnis]|uniref:GNAT family N-acetyltransferase n=1 Tax=Clostridium algidicarnis TaxID=37659 RepID=UPI001C0BE5F5|nr:GNAT family N-acetyltransferase [Clostridium algidicarnis]MBU3195201.1 GNAT family N-acetyltransferase [Clostridium algidicarnis]MBU3227612.1 GNAT family N-acetyltransferase [Clostridium algidicarnis]MBU3250981.1 GNAT family N-acetyltransferase [Clostridium algidicarnis]
MKRIETDRLIVRNFKPEDWKDLQEYVSYEEVIKYEEDWDTSDEGCKSYTKFFSKGDTFWAVELKDSKKVIGHVYFNRAKPERFLTWDLGYIFNPLFYGKGYATEGCNAILQYGFEKLGMHRAVAKCNPDNITSWRLLERISMRKEGLCKKAVTIKTTETGQPIWWDEYIYSILSEEWKRFECKYIEQI